MRKLITIFLFMAPPISVADAPSFDCSSKLNLTESTICNDHILSAHDVLSAKTYKILKNRNYPNLRESQLAWLKERNSCGNNIDCIKNSYDKRANEFLGMMINLENPPNGSYKYLNWRPTGIHSAYNSYGDKNDVLCNDFIKNINNDLSKNYILCKIPTIGHGFSRLDWEKLDFDSNKDLLETLYKIRRGHWFRQGEFDSFFAQQDEYELYKSKNEISYKGENFTIYMISRSCDTSDPYVEKNPSSAANQFFLLKNDGSYENFLEPWNMVDILTYKGKLYSYSFEMTVALHKEMSATVNDTWHHQINLFGLEDGTCRFVYTK